MCLFVLLLHTILVLFFYLCKQESLWSISCFLLCANYWMTFNQNLSRKKITLWLGVQYLHWRKQEREFEAFELKGKINVYQFNIFSRWETILIQKRLHLKLYVAAVQHLQSKLPLDIPFVKHAQFLHPEKCQLPGATSAISNFALSICSVHKTCLQDVFLTKSPVTFEEHLTNGFSGGEFSISLLF